MLNNGICGIHQRRKPRPKGSAQVRQAPCELLRRDFGASQSDCGHREFAVRSMRMSSAAEGVTLPLR